MKRSEAIELLKYILNEASGHLAEEVNPEWLLIRIEEDLRMLPPFVDQYENDTSLDLIGNRWEPEDEK